MTKVIVVDDERFVREGIAQNTDWESVGCEIAGTAANGLEGLELARKVRPQLVISDIRMPKLNGLEMVEKLRNEFPEIKVIFLTAHGEFSYAQQAVRLGASDYILKPFEDGELEETIRRILKDSDSSAGRGSLSGNPEELLPLKRKKECENPYVAAAIDYITQHYHESDLSVHDIADSLNVSEGHIMRLFKKETDMSVVTYLTNYRIRKSMQLLGDLSKKVYEIAPLVGYQDINYFSNTFKKLTGMSPSEYRGNRSVGDKH